MQPLHFVLILILSNQVTTFPVNKILSKLCGIYFLMCHSQIFISYPRHLTYSFLFIHLDRNVEIFSNCNPQHLQAVNVSNVWSNRIMFLRNCWSLNWLFSSRTRLRCQSRSTESEANRELPPLDCGSDRKCEKEDEYFHKKV